MAVSSKDIEILWRRYSDEGVKRGISVAQFFESNGVPYHTFEKWYKKYLYHGLCHSGLGDIGANRHRGVCVD